MNRQTAVDSHGPLAATMILELGSRISVSIAGSLLAQLGAKVIFVECAGPDNSSKKSRCRSQYVAGKYSIKLDAEHDAKLLKDLVARSDAIILSSDVLSDIVLPLASGPLKNVVCDVTAFGRGKGDEACSDLQLQALTGIMDTNGMSGGQPVPIAFPVVEIMTGVYAASAIIAALRVKAGSGAGQLIDMALYDCAFAAMATFLPQVLLGNKDPIQRIGNRHPMIAPWNVYRASDGWVLICVGNDSQWGRFCEVMGRPELSHDPRFLKTANRVANSNDVDQIVTDWVGGRSTQACIERLNAIQVACGQVVRIDQYPREANLDFRHMIRLALDATVGSHIYIPESPLRMSESPGRVIGRVPTPDADRETVQRLLAAHPTPAPGRGLSHPSAALQGIRIVEIGHYTTVPLSTRVLASLGAEVIKIEPPEGEATREWPPLQSGQGYFFTYMNSDKRSLVLDLRKPEDAAVLGALLKEADVLIENLKPGALARRGFAPEDLLRINPRLIYCAVSGFGSHSLYAGRPAYDTVIQAMSGIMDVSRVKGVPLKNGISIADLLGAEFAVLGVLAALLERSHTGRGQFVDLSMQDIAAWMTQSAWNSPPQQPGASVIACSDGYVLAEAFPKKGEALLADFDAADLSRQEVVARLKAGGIPAAAVRSVQEVVEAPQTADRRLWFRVADDRGEWPLLASPLRLSLTPTAVLRPMPALGRDSDAIRATIVQPAPTTT